MVAADRGELPRRGPKALILEAVRAGVGEAAVTRIAGMKKDAMAANVAELLDGTGWLPHLLRTPRAEGRAKPEGGDDHSRTTILQAAE